MSSSGQPQDTVSAHNPEQHPRDSDFHDVLLVRREYVPGQQRRSRLERFAIDKTTGAYRNEPETQKAPVRPIAECYRPTMNLATVGSGTEGDPLRGPVLSTLPLHPSPAASSATTCYLVNPENLNYVNAWTSEEWSDSPGGFDAQGRIGKDEFSVLIASPAGKVYYLQKGGTISKTVAPILSGAGFMLREVDLGKEPEIWSLLRSGCVVGRALYDSEEGKRVVPVVNIDSLVVPQTTVQTAQGEA